ncbi:zinc ABC transporter permease AztB [Mycolicibacterium neoaurum]|uniref:zinc ABC transporter permease AztB n=1 Tax=Mycolicibacterium neoaurum TaxID=1795 RepID=UPI00248B4AD9|nr:zinc ABC transporter permease AztB [Mycolicibacterium neoaurum]WBP93935.1 zinc ABC transporter permease AztB [Mycolicibacterium neoaurum]WBS07711.1 zinc ABC transporter permease AztB [Mycolicibacterium neoaurum]
MTSWLTEPFQAEMVLRALVAGFIAAWLCSLVGCWVLLRRSVFLGEAMTHGMLPGVAIAALLGVSLMAGGLVAALVMAVGVAAIGRSPRLSSDTGIGLLLVGMLALGVIVVSRSQSFAVDLTGFLFGDVFAVRATDLLILGTALVLTLITVVIGHRAFVAVTFDPRKAATLGLRPNLAIPVLTVLMAVAMVASFHVVGTLLVLGLLVAPPAAALLWARSIPRIMALAAVLGTVAVYLGLLISWHAGTAGGATIAGVAVLLFFASALLTRLRARWVTAAAVTAVGCVITGCATDTTTRESTPSAATADGVTVEDGAREADGPLTKLVLVDPSTGEVSVYDAVDETETRIGAYGPVDAVVGDSRFAYLRTGSRTAVIDSGAWTFDHGDHYHYFASAPAQVATLDVPVASVAASNSTVAVRPENGAIRLLMREQLGQRSVQQSPLVPPADAAAVVPYGSRLVTVTTDGQIWVTDAAGSAEVAGECRQAAWAVPTRRAVLFGCADGAIRITGGEKNLTVTAAPYPADAPAQRPTRMQHRARADVVAGVADGAVWMLDSRQRSWAVLRIDDALAANTAGDGTILVLHGDGALSAYDATTRAETARIPLFANGIARTGPQPVIDIDSDRAYVNNADAREVYEIDYADGLRIARTLRTDVSPGLMVEAGR